MRRHATDCSSLYDALVRANPSLDEKRVRVDARSIQAFVAKAFAHWAPTDQQLAGALAKVDAAVMGRCTAWLAAPTARLHD